MDPHEIIAKLGMFWAQGHSDKLRQGAGAHRQMATDLGTVQAACQSATDLVCTQNQGPPIDGFSTYWSKWQTDPGYFPATIQASNQLAEALDAYAQKIDEAHHRIIELATAAAVALGVGLLLTVFTFGGSDAAAGVTVAGLVAATFAEATGLSMAVATIVVGIGVGALEGMVFDGVVQAVAIDGFHDQKDFNWAEFGGSAAFGAVTGGLGAGGTMAVTRVGARMLPTLTDAVPVLGRTINALDRIPAPVLDGGIGLVTGTGFAAAIDEITTGQINPDDLLIGGLSGAIGGAVGGVARGRPATVDPRTVTPGSLEDPLTAAPGSLENPLGGVQLGTDRLSSAGDQGSGRYGVWRAGLPGVDEPAVVKVMPYPDTPEAVQQLSTQLAVARIAADAGVGAPVYGFVEIPTEPGGPRLIGFAMGEVPGGFTEAVALSGTPEEQDMAIREATMNALNINDQTFRDIATFRDALDANGYATLGDQQGFVGPDGRWRPIDFDSYVPSADPRVATMGGNDGLFAEYMDMLRRSHHAAVFGQLYGNS